MRTKSLITACLLVLQLLLPFPVLAQESGRVVPLEEGERAPFDGTLFDARAAARVLAELDYQEQLCSIQVTATEERARLEGEIEARQLQLSLEACQARADIISGLHESEIERLSDIDEPRPALWLSLGVAAGILITLGAAWAVQAVSD